MVSHHTKAIKSVEEKFGDRFSYLSDDHLNNVNLPRFKDLNIPWGSQRKNIYKFRS